MWQRIGAWYSRRVINVNVNVIAAGLLALIPVLGCVHLTEWALSKGIVDGDRLHVSDKFIIGAVTFFADIIFDVAIYYILHWLANHTPWLKRTRQAQIEAVADAAVESVPFFKDATKVQLQRAVLSPLLYFLWLGTQQSLLHFTDIRTTAATTIGFLVGVGAARSLHTIWMLREERQFKAKCQRRLCGKCGFDLKAMPLDAPQRCPECGDTFEAVRTKPVEVLLKEGPKPPVPQPAHHP